MNNLPVYPVKHSLKRWSLKYCRHWYHYNSNSAINLILEKKKGKSVIGLVGYRTRAIINPDLYIFTPFCTAVYNAERLILHDYFWDAKVAMKNRKDTASILCFFLVKFTYPDKATKFCEISAIDLSYVLSASQIFGGNFAKFWGLLRIYELYIHTTKIGFCILHRCKK